MAQELIDKIRAAAQENNVDPDVAVRIAELESSLNPAAKAKRSSARGLFQVIDSTWKEHGGKPGQQLQADENIRVGTSVLSANQRHLREVLGRDPAPSEMYAAHYFGPAGATATLTAAPGTPIEQVLPAKAIKANPNLKGKTTDQIIAEFEGKMGGKKAPAPRPTAQEPTEAEKIITPALQSGMTAKAAPDLGAGYQAALALAFMQDQRDDDEDEADKEEEAAANRIAEQELRDYKPFNALASVNWDEPMQLAEGGEVSEPNLFKVPGYAESVGREMYPGQQGQFDQQDAARHMLAAGTLARKYGPTAAEMLGNLHEIKTSPLDWIASKLGVGQMPVDYEQDLHNNRLGIELAGRSASQKELEALVQAEAERARREKTPGAAWIGKPVRRAEGGDAEPTLEELAAAARPATFNAQIARQGAKTRALAAERDVNTLPDPRTYAAVSGFLGTAPDEQGFSVMHPDAAGIRQAGNAGFAAGTAAAVAPVLGPTTKLLGKLAAQGMNERILAGQSPIPGLNMPSPVAFAVKPKGGLFAYTGDTAPITNADQFVSEYVSMASGLDVPQAQIDEITKFIRAKAPKYFGSEYGTANDPLRLAINERRLEPFKADVERFPPYLVDAARDPQARGNLQAKINLEKAYDTGTGVEFMQLRQPGQDSASGLHYRDLLNRRMAEEGVPAEAQNAPFVSGHTLKDFETYPSSTRTLADLYENRSKLPEHLRRALETGEPMFDVRPGMSVLRPGYVAEALSHVPVEKLKNMSFPEALVQGNKALAPLRDYGAAVDMAERGARVPAQALMQFTKPVSETGNGFRWVEITDPNGTRMEGALMKHSVAGYADNGNYGMEVTGLPYGGKRAYQDGLARVYSLRDTNGMPAVTVEVAKNLKDGKLKVTQIRGKFNSPPPESLYPNVFKLLDDLDVKAGLSEVRNNTYIKDATGNSLPRGVTIPWAREYDNWRLGAQD